MASTDAKHLTPFSHAEQIRITRIVLTGITGIAILVIIFQQAIEGLLFGGARTFVDEMALLTLAAVAVFIQVWTRRFKKLFLFLFLIGLYLILVSLFFGRNHSVIQVTLQSFLHLQYFIILFSVYVIHQRYPGTMRVLLIAAAVITAMGGIIQFAMPSLFSSVFGSPELTADRSGMLRMEGFQKNPNALGVFFAFFVVLLIYQDNFFKSRAARMAVILGSVGIIILTGSRSALLFVLIGVLFSNISLSKKFSTGVLFFAILAFAGVLDNLRTKTVKNYQNVVEQSASESRYIRWLMTYYGAELAVNNFPIGTGAATFGTALSHSSPVYAEVGISDLPTVSGGGGIHDSNFGSISGEFGVMGLIIFYGIGSYFIVFIFRKWKPGWVGTTGHWAFILAIISICVFSTFFRPLYLSSYYGTIVTLTVFTYLEIERVHANNKIANLIKGLNLR